MPRISRWRSSSVASRTRRTSGSCSMLRHALCTTSQSPLLIAGRGRRWRICAAACVARDWTPRCVSSAISTVARRAQSCYAAADVFRLRVPHRDARGWSCSRRWRPACRSWRWRRWAPSTSSSPDAAAVSPPADPSRCSAPNWPAWSPTRRACAPWAPKRCKCAPAHWSDTAVALAHGAALPCRQPCSAISRSPHGNAGAASSTAAAGTSARHAGAAANCGECSSVIGPARVGSALNAASAPGGRRAANASAASPGRLRRSACAAADAPAAPRSPRCRPSAPAIAMTSPIPLAGPPRPCRSAVDPPAQTAGARRAPAAAAAAAIQALPRCGLRPARPGPASPARYRHGAGGTAGPWADPRRARAAPPRAAQAEAGAVQQRRGEQRAPEPASRLTRP
ncbi:MAG: hypothetical protein MZV70_72130 [Desulfobacterales bacterium]|nr:hypothetical protein [Desulfobacterales bacterium]